MRRVQRGRTGLAVLQRDGGRDAGGGVLFGCGFVRGQGARLSRDQRALPWSPDRHSTTKFRSGSALLALERPFVGMPQDGVHAHHSCADRGHIGCPSAAAASRSGTEDPSYPAASVPGLRFFDSPPACRRRGIGLFRVGRVCSAIPFPP
ncbi:hypothetical protein AORI_1090 [Amycolatopsis keratiniphila]|uniref:Uncharacterized protein n=1 Tax=Amycolatopsis keratiniphila TaxID=129921 RepID=R4SJ83_9PSEU|nr:hypothetical protein AORI_1090 [Amycolatopsis keratiniphila]